MGSLLSAAFIYNKLLVFIHHNYPNGGGGGGCGGGVCVFCVCVHAHTCMCVNLEERGRIQIFGNQTSKLCKGALI